MAGTTGLEPATSAVTGQRSNQLSYVPKIVFNILAICHIDQRVRSFRYFRSVLSFRCDGLDFRPFGYQTGHQNHHCTTGLSLPDEQQIWCVRLPLTDQKTDRLLSLRPTIRHMAWSTVPENRRCRAPSLTPSPKAVQRLRACSSGKSPGDYSSTGTRAGGIWFYRCLPALLR